MKLIKKSDRQLKASSMLKSFREIGATTKCVGEYKRWKELHDGSRISVSISVYEIKNVPTTEGTKVAYLLEDTLGRVCAITQEDKSEIMGWLKEHGYKTVHDFYVQDYGMTEEAWAEWNGKE